MLFPSRSERARVLRANYAMLLALFLRRATSMAEFRPEGMAPTELDVGALIVDARTFGLVGELEIRKALRLQYPVGIVVIKPWLSPGEDGRRLVERIAGLVSPLVRQTDLIAVSATKPPALHVLLVDALPSDLDTIIARIDHEVHRHQVASPGSRERIRINLGGGCFPSIATTWSELVTRVDGATKSPA
jgi:hypothetical protein